MTIAKIEEARKRLEIELSDVEKQIAELNEALAKAAGDIRNDPKEAERLAARVVALEARKRTIEAAQKRNDKEAEQLQKQLETKEYRDGKKKLAELVKYFQKEADEVHAEILLLRERLITAIDKRAEYMDLLNRYGLELNEVEKTKHAHNKDIGYLVEVLQPLQVQARREGVKKGLDAISAEIVERNKKPPEARQPGKFRINFWESNYSDSAGKPIHATQENA